MLTIAILVAALLPAVASADTQDAKGYCAVIETIPDAKEKIGFRMKRQVFYFEQEKNFAEVVHVESSLFPGMKIDLTMTTGAIGKVPGFAPYILFDDEVTGSSSAQMIHLNYLRDPAGRVIPGASYSQTFRRKTESGTLAMMVDCHINQTNL
jgi:hypothetical protein